MLRPALRSAIPSLVLDPLGKYAFGFGDFNRLNRSALIACVYRSAEWDHKEIELAAHDLLQELDPARAK